MSLNITQTKKQTIIAPEGAHIARLYSIVDLGTQRIEWQGETKFQPKIRLTFELCNEMQEFDGKEKPLVVGGEYTTSLSDKARLKPIIEGILGKKLTDAEKANFTQEDFNKLVGKACMVTVLHTEKGENTYANLASVSPIPKGMEAPAQVNPSVLYDVSEGESETFKNLPKFIQDKIRLSREFRVGDGMGTEDTVDTTDLPF